MAFYSRNTGAKITEITPEEALAKLEHYCAYRDRCPQEVRQKMAELGLDSALAEQIYAVLESEGFVDEARFAYAFAGGKFRVNRWGRVRIRLELQRRAISTGSIETALASIDEREYRRVLAELVRKKKEQYRTDPEYLQRNKTMAALVRAGFEPELVFESY